MRLAELCAGYGGLGMALTHSGWPVELAWYAENDPDANTVMAAHHPHVPNIGDLTTADWSSCEPVDIIAAGYPCQPWSAAGKKLGMDDERWIWPDIADAVRTLRPRWVLLENVAGHLVRGAARVVADLAASGYVGSWCCVRASDVGAPHRRERLFILAHPADAPRDPRRLAHGDGGTAAHANGYAVRAPAVSVAGGCGATVVGGARAAAADADGQQRQGVRQSAGLARRPDRGAPSLLPTPRAADGIGGHLPTPRATDGTNGGPGQRGSSGDPMLPSAVQPDRWGAYADAIARWERALGQRAPAPTEPGRTGQPRLAARFVEWLMGLPVGHVTDHVGRSAALRILGNGVVPQQGAAAVRTLTHAVHTGGTP